MTFFLHDEGHQLGIFYDVALSLPKYLYADLKIEKVFFWRNEKVSKISSRLLLHFVFRKLIFYKKASKFRKIVVVIFFFI